MIEFRCDSCEKLLRVGDDKAGSRAKCPSCAAILLIPGAVTEAQASFAALIGNSTQTPEPDPYRAPEVDDTKVCPYCSETIKAAAAKCRFCGEQLVQEDVRLPRKFDIGKIIGHRWEVFLKSPALVVCTTFVTAFLPPLFFVLLPIGFLFVAGIGMGQRQQPADELLVIGFVGAIALCTIGFLLSSAVLHAGMLKVHEKLVRDVPTSFGEMFIPLSDFGKVVGLGIVLGGVYLVGTVACVIPGVIVALMYWPAIFLIHDEDCGVFESMARARKLTDNNWLNSFLVLLVYMAVSSSGAALFYIGVLLTMPLSYVFAATAFIVMRNEYEDRHGPLSAVRS